MANAHVIPWAMFPWGGAVAVACWCSSAVGGDEPHHLGDHVRGVYTAQRLQLPGLQERYLLLEGQGEVSQQHSPVDSFSCVLPLRAIRRWLIAAPLCSAPSSFLFGCELGNLVGGRSLLVACRELVSRAFLERTSGDLGGGYLVARWPAAASVLSPPSYVSYTMGSWAHVIGMGMMPPNGYDGMMGCLSPRFHCNPTAGPRGVHGRGTRKGFMEGVHPSDRDEGETSV